MLVIYPEPNAGSARLSWQNWQIGRVNHVERWSWDEVLPEILVLLRFWLWVQPYQGVPSYPAIALSIRDGQGD